MRKTSLLAPLLIAAAAGLAGGYYLNHWLHREAPGATRVDTAAAPADAVQRPLFVLPDLTGKPQAISNWNGKVVMVNFWASWCPPCRREIPSFIKLQDAYRDKGFVIVGVAIDTAQNVQDFIDPLGVNYPMLHGQTEAIDIAKAYGDHLGVLPYSVIIDRSGKIVYRHRNELSYEAAEAVIKPLL